MPAAMMEAEKASMQAPAWAANVPTRKLRVLLVITRLTVGGDTNVLLDIASHFRAHPAIEAEIAAGPVPETEIDLTDLARQRDIPTFIIPNLRNRPDPRVIVRGVLELRRLIKSRRYDVVHTHSSVAGVVGRLAAASTRVPVVVHHVHGWGLRDRMPLALKHTYLGLERFCAHFTDTLVAVSSPTMQKGITLGIGSERKYQVIYNGIDTARFAVRQDATRLILELGLQPGCKMIGMIGRLDEQKNPSDFIKVAALVLERYPRAQFLFIGDGSLRPRCEQLIRDLKLQQKCFLLGFRNDVHRILPILDVVASTSLWEGLPVAFQEAMCAGVPIVANDVDGVSDVVHHGETGYLVKPRNTQEMADRIVQLLDDTDLSAKFGKCARQASTSFSSERMLSEIEALYTRLANSQAKATTTLQSDLYPSVN